MAKIQVYPNRDDVPPHPIDGMLRPEGGMWTADQYTFRLIRDGDITETPPEGSGDPQRARAPENQPAPEGEAKADEDPGDKRKKPR